MTDTTTDTPQNYILYRTMPSGWQVKGFVIAAMQLTASQAIDPPPGFSYLLDADTKCPVGSIYAPSTDYTLTGDTTAIAGTPVTLTLTPGGSGPQADVTVTLSDGGAGGTFSSGTITFGAGSTAAQTVTYTPKAAGTVIISTTNNGGLTDPASLVVTVSAAAAAAS